MLLKLFFYGNPLNNWGKSLDCNRNSCYSNSSYFHYLFISILNFSAYAGAKND